MPIPCVRCEKRLESPDSRNASYIQRSMIVMEDIEDKETKEISQIQTEKFVHEIVCLDCVQPEDTRIW